MTAGQPTASYPRRAAWAAMVLCGATFGWVPFAVAQPLPEGHTGIAANYPGDVNIAADPAVIFADDFESYASAADLTERWDEAYHAANLRIATESGAFFAGAQAVELRVPATSTEVSNTLIKYVSPARDVLFLRFYAQYGAGFDVLGSSHNGAMLQANYCCPGVPADGSNKFLVSYEASRFEASVANPGQLNVYVYHPDQRDVWGDHFYPTGVVSPFTYLPGDFGTEFVARPDVIPELGRWYAYELMVQANTPGERDGRIAMWLDGQLIADFLNVRLRETTALKIDKFNIDLHVNAVTTAAAIKRYDNVVAATAYIGPLSLGDAVAPRAPANLSVR